jgi:hypothetical protein
MSTRTLDANWLCSRHTPASSFGDQVGVGLHDNRDTSLPPFPCSTQSPNVNAINVQIDARNNIQHKTSFLPQLTCGGS